MRTGELARRNVKSLLRDPLSLGLRRVAMVGIRVHGDVERTAVDLALTLTARARHLARIHGPAAPDVLDAVALFKAKVVDVTNDAVTIEVTGNGDKLASFLKVVEPFGIRELVQSGMVAIGRGSRSVSERTLRPVPVPAPPARTG